MCYFQADLAIYRKICYTHYVSRRIYNKNLTINGRQLNRIVIDPHYEEKHAGSVTDEVILELVSQLNGRMFKPVDVDDGFQYFVNDHLEYGGKFYKLIWLLEGEEVYIGIVNTYRR